MDDRDKTKEQLICELETLRRKTASLEAADVERKRAEHKLRENERLLRTLVDASPESILLLDTNETILLANETSAQRFGRLVDELVGKRPRNLLSPEVAAQRIQYFESVVRTGKAIRFEDERSGRYYENALHPVLDERGVVVAVAVLAIDRTEQKWAEKALQRAHDELEQRVAERTTELAKANEALRQSNDELRASYDGMFNGLLIVDSETKRVMKVNPSMCRLLGYSEKELLSMSVTDVHPADEVPRVLQRLQARAEGRFHGYADVHLVCKDGRVLDAEVAANFLVYGGRPSVIGFFHDVTKRKQAEEALRISEEKHRSLVEACPDAVIMTELDGTILFASQETAALFAVPSPTDMHGKSVLSYVIEDDRKRLAANLVHLAQVGVRRNTEYTALRQDRTEMSFEVSSALIRDSEGQPKAIMAVIRDITERKQSQEALANQQRTLKYLLQSSDHERQLISYEIHDGLAQQLAAAVMQFQAVDHLKDKDPKEAAKAYDAGLTMLRKGHAETRRLIAGVRPPILDESGVAEAITHLVSERSLEEGPTIMFVCIVSFGRLVPTLENAIYRICQEALTNACQHSKSERVRVSLLQRKDRVCIVVRDWGVGFNTKNVRGNRYGLEGIRQRAKLLGGKCSIRSKPGQGTRVVVELPVVAREEE
jgi:PAS domain S-box-containing protein